MSVHQVFRVDKLSDKGSIGGSGKHLFREIETRNAIRELTPTNIILRGPSTSEGIIEAVDKILRTVDKYAIAGKSGFGKIKKDIKPVLCLEYLITYTHGALSDPKQYFADSLEFLEKKHGKNNIVSAVIHNDELTPHLVVYAVPIHEKGGKPRQYNVADGKNPDGTPRRKMITKMVGAERWLSAKAFVGSPKQLSDMQTEFHEQVAGKYGLARGVKGSKATHQAVKSFYGKLDELPRDVSSLTREKILDYGRAAHIALTRQQEFLREQQAEIEEERKEAARELDALRKQSQAATAAQAAQLQAATLTIAKQDEQIRRLGAEIRRLGNEFGRRIGALLSSIWRALSEPGGGAAARRLLQAGARELAPDRPDLVGSLLPEPPELRVELRQLLDGGWRGSVIDRDDRDCFSELHDDQDSARDAAQRWIDARANAAPSM